MILNTAAIAMLAIIFSLNFNAANATSEIKNSIIAEQFPIPEIYQEYFNTNTPELYFFDNILIRSVNNASDDCPGFDHPMVMAQANSCAGWIHFIVVNSDPGISYSKQNDGAWLFVDVPQDQYKNKDPLYTQSETFFDNPRWSKPPEGTLCWLGTAFPLFYENGSIVIGNGFSWGFEWSSSEDSPQAMQITKIDSIHFKEYSSLFADDFDFLDTK